MNPYLLHRRKAFRQTGDPFWANVVFLQNFQGTNGSKPTMDQSQYAHALTWNGDAVISTAQSPFAGGSSLALDGSGDYIEIPNASSLNLSGIPFTIESWIRPTGGLSLYRVVYAKRQTGSTSTSYEGYLKVTTGEVSFYRGGSEINSTFTPSQNAWTYLAWVYTGTNIQIWAGVSGPTTKYLDVPTTVTEINEPLTIGGTRGYSEWFQGQIACIRITTLVRDVSTTPTAPFPTGP